MELVDLHAHERRLLLRQVADTRRAEDPPYAERRRGAPMHARALGVDERGRLIVRTSYAQWAAGRRPTSGYLRVEESATQVEIADVIPTLQMTTPYPGMGRSVVIDREGDVTLVLAGQAFATLRDGYHGAVLVYDRIGTRYAFRCGPGIARPNVAPGKYTAVVMGADVRVRIVDDPPPPRPPPPPLGVHDWLRRDAIEEERRHAYELSVDRWHARFQPFYLLPVTGNPIAERWPDGLTLIDCY